MFEHTQLIAAAMCGRWRRRLAAPLSAVVFAALAACNGTAVVTLTATPSTDNFLAYRVGLVSINLQTSSGRTSSTVLPSSTTVDLARLTTLSEIVGSSGVTAGTFSQAIVTLDYSAAQIVYDNGTAEGVALTPQSASGQALGQITLTLGLDPSNRLVIASKSSGRLSLDFKLAASNLVNLTQKTVTVTPLMAASSLAIDSKVVRIRGPLSGVDTSNSVFSLGIVPFDFGTSSNGSLKITPTTATTYEISGTPATGSTGLTQLAALSSGTMAEAFGTLTTSTSTSSTDTNSTGTTTDTCSDGTTPTTVNGVLECADGATLETGSTDDTGTDLGTTTSTSVSFSATQVLAGSSVQGSGFDRISGVVTGRSGNTLTIDDGTLLSNDGTNSFVFGTTTVNIGASTQVTQFGGGSIESDGYEQISVGSSVDVFGTASGVGSTSATVDASAGHARLSPTTASGVVAGVGSAGGTLILTLSQLGSRAATAFDFAGTGGSAGEDAALSAYQATTANLDLTNANVGQPVQVTGLVTTYETAGTGGTTAPVPDLTGTTLLDYTTIEAELVLDWPSGTQSPFLAYSTTQIQLDARNSAIGTRHLIQIGAQSIPLAGISSNPLIIPNATATNTVFTIGHAASGTFENFNTYSAFVTQLQAELTGTVLATSITAIGQYTTSTYTFSASSMTLFLNN